MIELYPSFKHFIILLLHYLFQAEEQDDAIAHPILAMSMCLWNNAYHSLRAQFFAQLVDQAENLAVRYAYSKYRSLIRVSAIG